MRKPLTSPARKPLPPPELFLLNADIVRRIFLRDEMVIERLVSTPLLQLGMSAVVAAQLHHACWRHRDNQRLEQAASLLLRAVEVCAWDARVARRYGALCYELDRAGLQLDVHQRQAAAHALSLNAVLVTADPVFLAVPGLPQEDWTMPANCQAGARHFGVSQAATRSANPAEGAAGATGEAGTAVPVGATGPACERASPA